MVYYINSYDDNINLSTDNLVIGFFDGLHIGHAKLFKNLKGNTTVLTFNFLKKNQKPIYSLQGVDSIVGRPWGAVIPKSFKTAPQIQPKSQKNCKKK